MRFRSPLIALLLLVVMAVAAGCGGGEAEESADSSAGSDANAGDSDGGQGATTTGGALAASTAGSPDSSVADSSATTKATTAATVTSVTAGTSSTAGSGTDGSTPTQPTSTEPVGVVLEPGEFGTFASPSGNILCFMQQMQASCWISDKQWTIEQPSGPFCDESDWGNAIDVTTTEVVWPCYTDFIYDPEADALAYGDAMVVGQFRCDSASTGVTCRNQSGQGFTLARAEVLIF